MGKQIKTIVFVQPIIALIMAVLLCVSPNKSVCMRSQGSIKIGWPVSHGTWT